MAGMDKYAPEEADALGAAAFDMMIGLLRCLRDSETITVRQGADVMRNAYWALMPKAGSGRPFPMKVGERLEEEVLAWCGESDPPMAK